MPNIMQSPASVASRYAFANVGIMHEVSRKEMPSLRHGKYARIAASSRPVYHGCRFRWLMPHENLIPEWYLTGTLFDAIERSCLVALAQYIKSKTIEERAQDRQAYAYYRAPDRPSIHEYVHGSFSVNRFFLPQERHPHRVPHGRRFAPLPGTGRTVYMDTDGNAYRVARVATGGLVPNTHGRYGWVLQRQRKLGNTDYFVISCRQAARTIPNYRCCNIPVQRAMMMAFYPDAFYANLNMVVDHVNGNKQDNRLGNLEMITPSENNIRAAYRRRSSPSSERTDDAE